MICRHQRPALRAFEDKTRIRRFNREETQPDARVIIAYEAISYIEHAALPRFKRDIHRALRTGIEPKGHGTYLRRCAIEKSPWSIHPAKVVLRDIHIRQDEGAFILLMGREHEIEQLAADISQEKALEERQSVMLRQQLGRELSSYMAR